MRGPRFPRRTRSGRGGTTTTTCRFLRTSSARRARRRKLAAIIWKWDPTARTAAAPSMRTTTCQCHRQLIEGEFARKFELKKIFNKILNSFQNLHKQFGCAQPCFKSCRRQRELRSNASKQHRGDADANGARHRRLHEHAAGQHERQPNVDSRR